MGNHQFDAERIVGLIESAGRGSEPTVDLLVGYPHAVVDTALAGVLERAVGVAWRRGWQPADVMRAVRRERTADHAPVAARAITTEARRYAAITVDPRWAAQLAAVAAEQRGRGSSDRQAVIARAIEVISLLRGLPTVPALLPRPGQASSAQPARAGVDGRLLDRVRALLAKAESTTFPEEADALTAKAQELMARHSIDRAMLDAERGGGTDAEGRRIGIDDPYAGPKALLLSQVAGANRCRSVWLSGLGWSDVFGALPDLDAVELLFTSLLRQATTAMVAERPGRRTRSFRHSFLVAYAVRIGERLRERDQASTAAAAAEHGPGVLPVLADRSAAADAAAEAAFPRTTNRIHSASDAAGWAAGTVAADLANLGFRAEVDGAAG